MNRKQYDELTNSTLVTANKWLPKSHRLIGIARVLKKHSYNLVDVIDHTGKIKCYHYHYLRGHDANPQ